jgi:hypothetical protein
VLDTGIRESGADIGNHCRIIDEDTLGLCRYRAGERGGEGRQRVEACRRIEPHGSIADFLQALSWTHSHRQTGGFAALRLAADLDDDALALVELLTARDHSVLRQEGGPIPANIDERRAEWRHDPQHAANMDAPSFVIVAARDKELDRYAILEQRRAPLARTGGDQQLASQFGR